MTPVQTQYCNVLAGCKHAAHHAHHALPHAGVKHVAHVAHHAHAALPFTGVDLFTYIVAGVCFIIIGFIIAAAAQGPRKGNA